MHASQRRIPGGLNAGLDRKVASIILERSPIASIWSWYRVGTAELRNMAGLARYRQRLTPRGRTATQKRNRLFLRQADQSSRPGRGARCICHLIAIPWDETATPFYGVRRARP